MRSMLPPPSAGTPENAHRADSLPVRAGSHPLRIDVKAESLAVINEIRTGLGLSVDTMARNAGCATSAMSDALAGKDGRNFAVQWLLAQGDDFLTRFNEAMGRRRGLTQEHVDELEAEEIGRVVTLLVRRGFRARAKGAA